MTTRLVVPALVVSMLGLSACKKAEIETYRVPKEKEVAAAAPHAHGTAPASGAAPAAAPAAAGGAMGGSMANTPVATASGPALTWTAPAHWKAKSGSMMRKGSYAVPGDGGAEADMAVTAFPGDVGGDLANLNRWRGQIQLPPVGQAEFESAVQRIERNGLKMTVVDVAGTGADALRILGAMVPHAGATWFFKMQGPEALVAKEKPAFLAMLDTIKAATPAQ